MKLRFGQIEAILQRMHDVAPKTESQFRAKLRNLKRVGLSVSSGGKGRKANFTAADLFKTAFAVELLQAGIPPEQTIDRVAFNWPLARDQIVAAFEDRRKGRRVARYLTVKRSALGSLSERNPDWGRFRAETNETLAAKVGDPLQGMLTARLLVIGISALLHEILKTMVALGLPAEELEAELAEAATWTVETPVSGFIGE